MYHVAWDDYEGREHELTFSRLSDAHLETAALERRSDILFVEIVPERSIYDAQTPSL